MKEKIVQVSGFAVGPPEQHAYLLVGVTNSGQVVMSQGDGDWAEVGPERNESKAGKSKAGNLEQENSAACGASALTDVLERMRARADNAYCDYIGQLRRDECLGWAIKVERGKFGEAELKAHCAAAEKLGRHRALHEAANMLADVLRSNGSR